MGSLHQPALLFALLLGRATALPPNLAFGAIVTPKVSFAKPTPTFRPSSFFKAAAPVFDHPIHFADPPADDPQPAVPWSKDGCTDCIITEGNGHEWMWVPDLYLVDDEEPPDPYCTTCSTETYVAYTLATSTSCTSGHGPTPCTAGHGPTSVVTNSGPAPAWFTIPPTNSAGTRIAAITYTDGTKVVTSEVAYPTGIYRPDDAYEISGSHYENFKKGNACVGFNATVKVDPNAPLSQKLLEELRKDLNPEDPLGWGYTLIRIPHDPSGDFYVALETPPIVAGLPSEVLETCHAQYVMHTGGKFRTWRRVRGR